MVTLGGETMSKSKGNVIDPGEIIDKYGPDTARMFILFAASPEAPLDWSETGVESTYKFLNRFMRLFEKQESVDGSKDKLVMSKMHRTIKAVGDEIEKFELNTAIIAMMDYVNFLHKQREHTSAKAFNDALRVACIIFSPIVPHLCEECWEALGEKPFVSLHNWPKFDEKKIDVAAETADELCDNTRADILRVLELAKIAKPTQIMLIVAPQWKYDLVKLVKEKAAATRDTGLILKEVMKTELKKYGQDITKLVPKLVEKAPDVVLDEKTEIKALEAAAVDLSKEFGCKVSVVKASDSKDAKAKVAMPGKCAILVN
jgi:leucyl-tRNA synthetase